MTTMWAMDWSAASPWGPGGCGAPGRQPVNRIRKVNVTRCMRMRFGLTDDERRTARPDEGYSLTASGEISRSPAARRSARLEARFRPMRRHWANRLLAFLLIVMITGGGGGLPVLDALIYHSRGSAPEDWRAHYEANSGCHADGCA